MERQDENQREMQKRVDRIVQWASDWKMEINPVKFKVMHLGKNNPGLPYFINGTEIKAVTTEKDIGFWITWTSQHRHVHKARSKALGEIARIKRNFSYIDKQAFCVLYNQRIRPQLDYSTFSHSFLTFSDRFPRLEKKRVSDGRTDRPSYRDA